MEGYRSRGEGVEGIWVRENSSSLYQIKIVRHPLGLFQF